MNSNTLLPNIATLRRRDLLKIGAAASAGAMVAVPAWAQGAPIKLGALLPLTGAGGPYGGPMAKAAKDNNTLYCYVWLAI